MNDTSRLIEHAFPLTQASLDSVHEKNVRHGHISTLHIWPARRPLAACRAALLATLLPDPGTPEKRKELCERIGGKLVKITERKKMPDGSTVERETEVTEGGILRWLDGEPDKTSAFIEHARFFEGSDYKPQIGSGVKDIYQNCFKPSAGLNCNAILNPVYPYCCNGVQSSSSCN